MAIRFGRERIKRFAERQFKSGCLRLSRQLSEKNFRWLVTWFTTYTCNLKCCYCPAHSSEELAPVGRAVEVIIRQRPKYVVVSGGEPTLVPTLKRDIERIKAETGAFMRIVTNGTRPDRLIPLIPSLDIILVSVDGLGKINELTRKVDGQVVLDTVEKVAKEATRNGCNIVTGSVVTLDNFREIEAFVKKVDRISSDIFMIFTPLLPPDHPLSIASDPSSYRTFLDILENLKDRYNIGTIPADFSWTRKKTICFRQFFTSIVYPDGTLSFCKPYRYLDYYLLKLREGASKGKIGEAIGAAKEIFHRLVLHKYDPQCPFPCNCMEELEDIFHEEEGILRRGSVSGKALYLFQEKLPLQDEEIDRAWGFLKRELNPRFERRSLEFLQSRKIEKKFDQEPIPKLRLNP